MKSYYKSELADVAGVSVRTFARWLRQHRSQLAAMGVNARTQLLPPQAVKYLCDMYCIELDE